MLFGCAVVGVEAAQADIVRRLLRHGEVLGDAGQVVLHLRLQPPGVLGQVHNGEQLLKIQLPMPHVLVVDVYQAGPLHGIAQLGQHVDLIGHVLVIDGLGLRGAFDLVELHPAAAEVFQNVHAAKEPFTGEGSLRDDGRAGLQQFQGLLNHPAQVAVGNLHVVSEQPHRQIPDLAAGLQNGLVHNGFVEFLRLVFLQPKHLRALHPGAIF